MASSSFKGNSIKFHIKLRVTEILSVPNKLRSLIWGDEKLFKTSKSVDPLTPLTLIYESVTLPIMCKCMYRNSSRISTH